MKPTKQQRPQEKFTNDKNKKGSTFVRTRNQNKDIPLSASKIKKRIRDVKRTLSKSKGNVSAEVITESKRRLRVLEYELGEKVVDETEKKNMTAYHMVKHFERNKAERKLRSAQKEFDAQTDPVKKAKKEQDLINARINLFYVLHYPKTQAYVSLYPKEDIDNPVSTKRRNTVLKDIREAYDKGDTTFTEMQKRYRAEYKQKLIKRGLIQPEAPVAVDEDMDIKQDTNDKNDGSSSSSSSEDEGEKDDFFEKA